MPKSPLPRLRRWLRQKRSGRPAGLKRHYQERRRITVALVVLLCLVAAGAYADLRLGDNRDRAVDLAFNIGYGAAASVLATLLVAVTQLQFRIKERLDQGKDTLRLLGITPGRNTSTALVVTAWTTGRDEGASTASEHELLGPLDDKPDGLDRTTYVRRDMLLVADLIRLLQKAGLEAPHIVSDEHFLEDFKPGAHRSRRVQVKTDENNKATVTNVVVIGLWGNKVTERLVGPTDRVLPFRLDSTQGQSIRTFGPDADDEEQFTNYGPQKRKAQVHGFALIARFHLKDVVLSILGGTYGLPTARLGDLLASRPPELEALIDIDPELDMWTGIRCPGEGRRFKPYVVDTPYVARRRYQDHWLADLLAKPRPASDGPARTTIESAVPQDQHDTERSEPTSFS